MICPVCHGSGITRVTHLRVVHTLGVPCGGCGGTGVLSNEREPDHRPLYDQMIAKHCELREAISEVVGLPSELKRRWCASLDDIGTTQSDAEARLRGLRSEVDEAESEHPECELALIYCGLGELARMCEDYREQKS